jgi:hypothetical protein
MSSFPLLSTDAVAQYPSSRLLEFSTGVLRFVDGAEQRYRNFHQPTRRWVLRLHKAGIEELQAIEDFFVSRQGQTGSFSFTDPWDGVTYPDCSFDGDEVSMRLEDEGHSASTIVIRNNQV